MPHYELGVILDPEVPPEEEAGALERLEKIITEAGGSVVAKDCWGRRQLAYPIDKRGYGVYHFWKFEVGGQVLAPLNFEMRTNDVVLRSLVLNLDRELRRKKKGDLIAKAKVEKKAAEAARAAEAATAQDQ